LFLHVKLLSLNILHDLPIPFLQLLLHLSSVSPYLSSFYGPSQLQRFSKSLFTKQKRSQNENQKTATSLPWKYSTGKRENASMPLAQFEPVVSLFQCFNHGRDGLGM
jgi:hypothetical protein